MAQRAPETLTLVRHRTQLTAETIVRLTVTAVFAYLISLTVPGTSHSVLAPLTALLVAQVSLYQTLRSAISRVAAVVAGVLLAVGLAALVGFVFTSPQVQPAEEAIEDLCRKMSDLLARPAQERALGGQAGPEEPAAQALMAASDAAG